MELKLTTVRALKYEEETGKDILVKLKDIADSGAITVRDAVQLFKAMGENYTPEVFDAWDAPFADKVLAMIKEVERYSAGSSKK